MSKKMLDDKSVRLLARRNNRRNPQKKMRELDNDTQAPTLKQAQRALFAAKWSK